MHAKNLCPSRFCLALLGVLIVLAVSGGGPAMAYGLYHGSYDGTYGGTNTWQNGTEGWSVDSGGNPTGVPWIGTWSSGNTAIFDQVSGTMNVSDSVVPYPVSCDGIYFQVYTTIDGDTLGLFNSSGAVINGAGQFNCPIVTNGNQIITQNARTSSSIRLRPVVLPVFMSRAGAHSSTTPTSWPARIMSGCQALWYSGIRLR